MVKLMADHFDERFVSGLIYDKKVVLARQKLTPSLDMAHK